MAESMNKSYVLDLFKQQTNVDDNTLNIIGKISEEYSIVGKKNKTEMINAFIKELNVDENTAESYYEILSSIIMNCLKEKIKHPFRSID